MFKVSILYPNKEGTHFNMDYYVRTHMPLVQSRLNPMGLKGIGIERGVNGGSAGSPAPYHCMGHLLFDTLDAYQTGMKTHGMELAGDIRNFTNTAPVFQISEIIS